MSAPEIHLTESYAGGVYHPHCPASNAIARAFETRTFSRRALAALQDVGVTVIIDGQPQAYLATNDDDRGLEPIGDVLARNPLHNQQPRE